ncbi:hypothetical protein YC2023_108939 [Brassica napus]
MVVSLFGICLSEARSNLSRRLIVNPFGVVTKLDLGIIEIISLRNSSAGSFGLRASIIGMIVEICL